MTTQLPAPKGMQGDGTALPFTLSFGHSRFWVTNTNPQGLLWSSHKMQTLLLQVCAWGWWTPHEEQRLALKCVLGAGVLVLALLSLYWCDPRHASSSIQPAIKSIRENGIKGSVVRVP